MPLLIAHFRSAGMVVLDGLQTQQMLGIGSQYFGRHYSILLRLSASDYVVLGDAYVDDMMDGQAFRGPKVQIETITLV